MKQRRGTSQRRGLALAAVVILWTMSLTPAYADAQPTAREQLAYRIGYYLDCGISPYLAIAYEMQQIDNAVRDGLLTPGQRDVLMEALVPVVRDTAKANAVRYQWVADTMKQDFNVPEKDLTNLRKQVATFQRAPEVGKDDDMDEVTALLVAYLTRASSNFSLSAAVERRLKDELSGDEVWYYNVGSMIPFIAETLRNGRYNRNVQESLIDILDTQPKGLPAQIQEPLAVIKVMLADDKLTWSERQQTIKLLNDIQQFLAPDDAPFLSEQHIIPWPTGTTYIPGKWGDGPGVLA